MPLVRALLAAVVCGLLYGLCFPPVALRPLAWVVLVPACVAMRVMTFGRALVVAGVLATAGAYAAVSWLPHTVTVYFHQPFLVGIALFLGVTLIMVVPSYVAFAACYKVFSEPPGPALPLLAGAAWVAGEFARSHLLTGNPWVLFGYTQATIAPVVQIADVTGVYGITFVLVVVAAALAELWLAWRRNGRPTRLVLVQCALAAFTVALALGYGYLQLSASESRTMSQPGAVDIAIVQGNLDVGAQWRPDFYGKNLEAYERLTLAALQQDRVQLVVWPETAMTFFIDREPRYRQSIASVLQPWGAQLVAGGPHTWDTGTPKFYNSTFTISPAGEVLARYDKQRLLPFSEYFPLPDLDFLRRDFGRVREFTPGASSHPLPTVAGPAGVLTCNEAMFPEIARERVRAGAEYLLNLSNDSWVHDEQFARLAFDMSVLRAVEQRRFLVRASTSGPSAIVDPLGRVAVQTQLFRADTAVGTIAPHSHLSVYARIGDSFAWACIVITMVALTWRLARKTTRSHSTVH